MNPIVKNSIGLTIFLLGLICIARGVLGAEPFKAALIKYEPGQPQEVAWLYPERTACDVDAWMPPKAPDGTVFSCKPIERRKP